MDARTSHKHRRHRFGAMGTRVAAVAALVGIAWAALAVALRVAPPPSAGRTLAASPMPSSSWAELFNRAPR